jgi:hypothetical protein
MGKGQEGGFYKRSRIRIERERRTTYLRRASSSRGSQSLCIHRIGDLSRKRGGNGRARRGYAAAAAGCRNQALHRNLRDLGN